MREVTEALLALLQSGREGALATVIETTGSTPQVAGARLLLDADGRRVGTVGGGAIEQRVVEALDEVNRRGSARVLGFDLAKDLGMCCGGSMKLFLEPIRATPRLTIFGAGHVAQPTAALAASAGFELVVVDERDEWNTAERFPGCRRELLDVATALRTLQPSQRDWLLIVTHDHQLDTEALRLALASDAHYVGLVGSRRKVYRLLQRVVARDGPVDLRRLYAPVGLDLGAVSPAEIAVSIVAELIALRHQGGLGHLRTVDDARLRASLVEHARMSDETADDLDVSPPPRGFDSADVNGDDTP
ncbi:MAG TPA: XdhC/CoxI family protein [Polyangiaceae bacterium]|nr:XdhC/CoxI family protein [Polyangiaceae bacterium]